jgi:hypothetical protein
MKKIPPRSLNRLPLVSESSLMTTIRSTCPRCGEVDMRPGQVLLHAPLDGRSVYQFTCPACFDPVEKPADRRAAALLLAAGVAVATEESLLGDLCGTDPPEGGVEPDHVRASYGPPLTLDDLLAFHFLLLDDVYSEEFLDRRSS